MTRRIATRGEGRAGWLFVSPAVVVMLLFLVAPMLMALWVSLLHWDGQSSPFGGGHFVGLGNYTDLLGRNGLARHDFATSIRNTLYYVLIDVPAVAALAFLLAMVVNQQVLRGRGFFRTVFYFPSITSSVAIGVTFLFLFQGSGAVNAVLAWFGIHGPNWFTDSRGLIQIVLSGTGLVDPQHLPGWLDSQVLSLSVWDWLAGPSVAMVAIIALTVWSSSGTFMLFYLSGLQNIPVEVEEAAAVDGAGPLRRFRYVTLPLMRRSVVLVVTLALIGSWQVFDQVYVMSQGSPGKTTLTPAYLSYTTSFGDGNFGGGAAIAFVLFAIIIVFTAVQRWLGRERGGAVIGESRTTTRTIGYGILLLGTILYLGPFVIQLATSLKTDPDATAHPLSLLPDPLSWAAWRRAFGLDSVLPVPLARWLFNSFFVTISVTLGRLVIDSLAGYALARLRFTGRRAVNAGILAVLAIPGVVLLIPKFLVLKQLGMFDSYSGMIIPLFCDAVGILLMKTAFEQVPTELEEAARIDGAGVLRTFTSVVLPLVRPALVTVGILSFQGSWNEFTHFLVATSDPKYQTLTLGIAQLTAGQLNGAQQFPLKLALATLSTIPVAIVYILFQRHFVRSQLSSGIK